MSLKISHKTLSLDLEFRWEPLTDAHGARVPIWKYPSIRKGHDTPVIYRHCVKLGNSHFTIYVGEGKSLSGPSRNHLVHQYSRTPGETRRRIRDYARSLPTAAVVYTEILQCEDLDLSDKHLRWALEQLFVHLYKSQSQQNPVFATNQLEFLNR